MTGTLAEVNLFDCLTRCTVVMQALCLLLYLRGVILMFLPHMKYSTSVNSRNSELCPGSLVSFSTTLNPGRGD